MTSGYYVVMVLGAWWNDLERDIDYEEYTGHHWGLDQELEAQEELWDAKHDEDIVDAYIKEVVI